jgi:hypothetical protein
MLQTLDVLIGFALVMLIMSAAVTMLTQFFGTWLLNLKGRALLAVVTRLLTTLDRGLTEDDARSIADYILRDPLIAQPRMIGNRRDLAVVVHREELVKLIFAFASGGDLAKAAAGAAGQEPAELARLRRVMKNSLDRNGIKDPEQVLGDIRLASLELEKASPELSNSARATLAMIDHATSDFLGKVNSWFDQTIDRASDIFTVRIRVVTVCVSLVLALVVQLNSFELINRLSVDNNLREKLVAAAIDRANAAPVTAPGQAPPTIEQAITDSGADKLEALGLIRFPGSAHEWACRWTDGWFLQLLGIVLSAALLSLGAPFWYSLLANMVQLRSVVAAKDDLERATRQAGPSVASTK